MRESGSWIWADSLETNGENLEVCQGLINTELLGESEGSSGRPLSFLGSPTPKSSRTKQAIQLLFTQVSLHVSQRPRQTSQSSNLQPGGSICNLRGGNLHLCRAELLNSFSVLQMIGPGYHFHSLYWKNWRGNGGLVEYEYFFPSKVREVAPWNLQGASGLLALTTVVVLPSREHSKQLKPWVTSIHYLFEHHSQGPKLHLHSFPTPLTCLHGKRR